MKRILAFGLALFAYCVHGQQPTVSSGTIRRFASFPSRFVEPRNVDVWLPDGYSNAKKYAVLYMHDGQMLFDSTTTWNKQEWGVDEIMSRLLAEKKIRDCIVVGVWNRGEYRHAEYFPQKPFESIPQAVRDSVLPELHGKPLANKYLRFLVNELKPFIDSTFSTYRDPAYTFIAGSSMGGLISMYAICEYPDVFGGAACLSTHWVGSLKKTGNAIPIAFNEYLAKKLPDPRTHKIYFDYGTVGLDALYEPHQKMVDKTMQAKGYTLENWLTKGFPGADHSEKSWRARLSIPVLFLLQ